MKGDLGVVWKEAGRPSAGGGPVGAAWFLLVRVGRLGCALPVGAVTALHRAVRPVVLPGAPEVVEGIIDVHGSTVVVIDVRRRLGLETREVAAEDHLVLVESSGRPVALRVDRVEELVELDEGSLEVIEPGDVFGPGVFVSGVARTADGLVVVADLDAFLTGRETAELDAALSATRSGER